MNRSAFVRTLLGGAAFVLAATAMTGCVIAPAQPYYRDSAVVTVPPPQPQYEVVGVAPFVGALWIAGFWNWVGGRHVWVGGHWEAPRRGYRWAPHRWEPISGGWRPYPGHWERG